MAKVYIVHCIDTEGPLYEGLSATFERLEAVFGIEGIEPTEENLKKLQRGGSDLGGKEKEVARMLDASLLSTHKNFAEIEAMMDRLNSAEFREGFPDSGNGGWKCSWFCMDHAGFTGENPRMRIAGHHSIYDWYRKKAGHAYGDLIQWHFHPLPVNGEYNACGMNYVSSPHIFEILARKVIDRGFFPSAYRPGFHTERPDSHWLLEQWIPFDYANQAVKGEAPTGQRDVQDGRFGNWAGAVTSWEPYHPDYADYRKKGDCKRAIARCLNMNTRMRNISKADFEQAFCEARKGKDQLVSFTDHDFRDVCYDIELMRGMLRAVAQRYPDVPFEYCNALEGMRRYFKLEPKSCRLEAELGPGRRSVRIRSDENIFGAQPFFCLKLLGGKYIWSNLDFTADYEWAFTFDRDSVEPDCVERIGIAANSASGVTDVIVMDAKTGNVKREILNMG